MPKLHEIALLLAGSAVATWVYNLMRSAGGSPKRSHHPIYRAVEFPTDNRLRDDVGLPPLTVEPRPARRRPDYFPADDRLRDDIGLPPLDADR